MRQCMDAKNLHQRLNRIQGQIKAIDKMVDQDVPCEDILIQVNAAKSALHKVGQIILEGHLNHCVRDGIEHGDADKTIADFARAGEKKMASYEQDIKRYESKMRACATMTELLTAMASWQSFAEAHSLTDEERQIVDKAYVEAEAGLITQVKPTLW